LTGNSGVKEKQVKFFLSIKNNDDHLYQKIITNKSKRA